MFRLVDLMAGLHAIHVPFVTRRGGVLSQLSRNTILGACSPYIRGLRVIWAFRNGVYSICRRNEGVCVCLRGSEWQFRLFMAFFCVLQVNSGHRKSRNILLTSSCLAMNPQHSIARPRGSLSPKSRGSKTEKSSSKFVIS